MKALLCTIVVCSIYYCLAFESSAAKDAPTVETNTGTVVGKYETVLNTDIATFLGIPFAQPPLGKKRFASPEPIKKWNGKFLATKKSPACMQYSSRNFTWIPLNLNKSEDCLYLNIWAPVKYNVSKPKNKLPVMVYIYGGGYSSGSASMKIYDSGVFAAVGDVIVVSMNFRVGLFGFLNGGIKSAPGNVGLLDQILALKWIKANIQNFGGDPSSITLFGDCDGATSIALYAMSPLAKGLFQRAILQSGTPYMPTAIESNITSLHTANEFAERVGCSTKQRNLTSNASSVIDCLQTRNAVDLAKEESASTSKYPFYFVPIFGTSCKECDTLLSESPSQLLKRNNISQLPMLLGFNENEGSLMLNYDRPDLFPMNKQPNITIDQAKIVIKGSFPVSSELHQKIFDFYVQNVGTNNTKIVQQLSRAVGDFLFDCPALYLSEKLQEAYLFYFTHLSSKGRNAKWVGATNFDEVQYVFGNPITDSRQYSHHDRKFSFDIIRTWASFARTGYPSGNEINRVWAKFNSSNPMVYELHSNRTGMLPFPRKEACEFWRPHLTK